MPYSVESSLRATPSRAGGPKHLNFTSNSPRINEMDIKMTIHLVQLPILYYRLILIFFSYFRIKQWRTLTASSMIPLMWYLIPSRISSPESGWIWDESLSKTFYNLFIILFSYKCYWKNGAIALLLMNLFCLIPTSSMPYLAAIRYRYTVMADSLGTAFSLRRAASSIAFCPIGTCNIVLYFLTSLFKPYACNLVVKYKAIFFCKYSIH